MLLIFFKFMEVSISKNLEIIQKVTILPSHLLKVFVINFKKNSTEENPNKKIKVFLNSQIRSKFDWIFLFPEF